MLEQVNTDLAKILTIKLLGSRVPYMLSNGKMCMHLIKYEDKYYLENVKEHRTDCDIAFSECKHIEL